MFNNKITLDNVLVFSHVKNENMSNFVVLETFSFTVVHSIKQLALSKLYSSS